MNEDKSTDHQPESLDVGFREKDPRYVHHQYELDRLFREWHSARDNNTALRKGRAIISTLLRWIEFGEEFDADDLKEAKKAIEDGKVTIKTKIKQQDIGTGDESYKVEWDSYSMYVRPDNLTEVFEFARAEAIDVKLDAQAIVIATLLGICDRKKVLDRDYRVGLRAEDSMRQGAIDGE